MYSGTNIIKGIVDAVNGALVFVKDPLLGYQAKILPYHRKQCRLLTKKPKKTIWVNEYPHDGVDYSYYTREGANSGASDGRIALLECRVVKRHKV